MKSYKALQIKLSKKISGDFLGNFMSAFRGNGMEFHSLREYFPGDNVKKIDWKTTAKHHKTFVKNYQQEKDINALFIFDIDESFCFGSRNKTKLETTQEIFYMLAYAASYNGFSISSLIGEKYLEPANGEKNIIKTLDFLDTNSWKQIHSHYLKSPALKNIKNNLIFILSNKTNVYHLQTLSLYNDVVYINVFDQLESSGSEEDFLLSLSGMMQFFSKRKQKNYIEKRESSLKIFQSKLKQKQIRYLAVDDRDNLLVHFYKFFAKTR